MALQLCFVDRQEVRRINIPDGTTTPYGVLQRALASLCYGPWRAVWQDDFNNFFAIQSDASLHQALASRRHPSQPIRILIKENGPMRGQAESRAGQLRWRQDGNLVIAHRFNDENFDGRSERSRPAINKFRADELVRRAPEGGERRQQPAPSLQLRTSFLNFQHGNDGQPAAQSPFLPKDPTLAELVDKVRKNLEGAIKSVENSMYSSSLVEHNETLPNKVEQQVDEVVGEEEVDSEMSKTVCGSLEKDEGIMMENAESVRAQLLNALWELPLRPESALSEEFTIITPSTDHNSLVVFDKEELEAALCELNSDIDAFEVVANPDDWDSDGDWNCV